MEKRFFRIALAIFAGLLLFGFAGIVSQGNRLQSEDRTADPIYKHGYQVGYTLAKSGMAKPNADELDAYATKAAVALEDKGGLGFKMAWKSAFWTGWSRGD